MNDDLVIRYCVQEVHSGKEKASREVILRHEFNERGRHRLVAEDGKAGEWFSYQAHAEIETRGLKFAATTDYYGEGCQQVIDLPFAKDERCPHVEAKVHARRCTRGANECRSTQGPHVYE